MAKIVEPVFIYTSTCCQARATKEPCAMPKDRGVRGFGERPEGEATLGSWRCGQCRRPAKVTRALNPTKRGQNVTYAGR